MSALPYTGLAEGKRRSRTDISSSARPHRLRGTSEIHRAIKFVFRPGHSVCCGEMAGILAWFWNERFWLPHNVTWADLKNTDEATFPQAEDLYLACPLAFCIFMIRLVFERWVRAHAINSGVCDAVRYVGELNDASTARRPRLSASYPNNGISSA